MYNKLKKKKKKHVITEEKRIKPVNGPRIQQLVLEAWKMEL